MKLGLFLIASVLAQLECQNEDECDSACCNNADQFCIGKEELVKNKRLYDNAVRRYEEQEADFNKLAKCYNAVYDNGGFSRLWNNHCGSVNEPCEKESDKKLTLTNLQNATMPFMI